MVGHLGEGHLEASYLSQIRLASLQFFQSLAFVVHMHLGVRGAIYADPALRCMNDYEGRLCVGRKLLTVIWTP